MKFRLEAGKKQFKEFERQIMTEQEKARQERLEGLEGFERQLMEGIMDLEDIDGQGKFIPSVFLTEKVTASLMSLLRKGKIDSIDGSKRGIFVQYCWW